MCRKGIFLTTQRAGTAKMPLSSFVLPIIDNGMKAETPSFEAHQFVRVRRGDAVRRLIQRDKTPLAVLFMAAVVGTLAGLVGVAFEKSVNWVQNQRIGALAQVADHWYLVWPLAFILSALLAMVGYFLVRRFAPEAGGSGIPEIEGALEELRPVRWWRVLPVKFVGGMGTLGAGMVLGREGPMVQLGGNIGRMVLDVFRMRSPEARHTLLATGAASGLSAGMQIDPERLAELVGEAQLKKAKEKALHYLSYKEYTASQLKERLLRDVDEESAALAVGRMEELGLVDDDDYAERFARDLYERKRYGLIRIRQEMRQRGLADEQIEFAVSLLPDAPLVRIRELIEKKYPLAWEDEKVKRRAFAAMLRMGYCAADVRKALGGREDYD